MPVLWGTDAVYIEQVQNKAITIQQLCDVELFLQRLCKVNLLKQSAWDAHPGSPVNWFDVNMYHIANLVIKPLIEHVESTLRGTNRRYSWVELVAQGPQLPHILFSHAWAGKFRDFMAVVRSLARNRWLSLTTAVWVCTFANNQFGQEFGDRLDDSPFVKAIKAATAGTVLIVDRSAISLERSWCGLELFKTREKCMILENGSKQKKIANSGANKRRQFGT